VKSPGEEKNVSIRLSGCVNRSDINIGTLHSPHDGPSGSWATHLLTVFPSNKLAHLRKELHGWWRDVERLCQVSTAQVEADSAKNRFFLYSKSQSAAYRQAMEAGLHTPQGQQSLGEYEEFRVKCKQAAFCLSSAVLDSLFSEGEILLTRLVGRPPPQLSQQSFATERTESEEERGRVAEIKDSLKRCKGELHQAFEKSLYRLATSLEAHEKHAWETFHSRYTLGRMDDLQVTAAAEDLLRSARANKRPKTTSGGRNTRDFSTPRKISAASADLSLFSLSSRPRQRHRGTSHSPPRRGKVPRPKTSPSVAPVDPLATERKSEKRSSSNERGELSVHFAKSPFDKITSSLHPDRRKSLSPSRQRENLQPPPSTTSSPEHQLQLPLHPQSDLLSSLHRTSMSIIQTSQNLMLTSVRNRLQSRLELYRKDKTYNFFGTFIHQVVFQFQILLFETAVRYEMDRYLEGEYDRMMGSVERSARKEFVALTAVQSKEKVQLLSQGIVSARGMWSGRTTEGAEENESPQHGPPEPPVLVGGEEGTHVAVRGGLDSSRLDSAVLGEGGEEREPGEGATTRPKRVGTGEDPAVRPLPLSFAHLQPPSSPSSDLATLSTLSGGGSLALPPSPTKQQQSEMRYTALQHKHSVELNEFEYQVSEKKRSKGLQFSKMKFQTNQILNTKLQTIRSHGMAAELSPTGVALFNNICHVYQFLRACDPYLGDGSGGAIGGGGPEGGGWKKDDRKESEAVKLEERLDGSGRRDALSSRAGRSKTSARR
jgi:hypothetical protein